MDFRLTRGSIMDLSNGVEVTRPILQVLDFKKMIHEGNHLRYCLFLSDGEHCCFFGVIAPGLNFHIDKGKLSKFTVISLEDYIHPVGRAVVIFDLVVRQFGADIGGKIGNPTTLTSLPEDIASISLANLPEKKDDRFSAFESFKSVHSITGLNSEQTLGREALMLTSGALMDVMSGIQVKHPILQVLSFKKLTALDADRYRLFVSDGKYCSSFAMLCSQLNFHIEQGSLEKFTVIRLDNYLASRVHQDKIVMIILDFTILHSAADVNRMNIGNPAVIMGLPVH